MSNSIVAPHFLGREIVTFFQLILVLFLDNTFAAVLISNNLHFYNNKMLLTLFRIIMYFISFHATPARSVLFLHQVNKEQRIQNNSKMKGT
jgi:hypothetical protein